MNYIVNCESRYIVDAVGDMGHSFGLVQIYMPVWHEKGITYDMATDPEFALDFLARQLKNNNGKIWTCYRKMPDIVSSTD